jgi:hypothetical protein
MIIYATRFTRVDTLKRMYSESHINKNWNYHNLHLSQRADRASSIMALHLPKIWVFILPTVSCGIASNSKLSPNYGVADIFNCVIMHILKDEFASRRDYRTNVVPKERPSSSIRLASMNSLCLDMIFQPLALTPEGRTRLHTARKKNSDESKHSCGWDNLAGPMEGGMDYNHL